MTDPNHHAEMESHYASGLQRSEDADLINRMMAALEAAEKADLAHNNCDECDPEDAPETCSKCFPLADDARLMRRAILAASIEPPTSTRMAPRPASRGDEAPLPSPPSKDVKP